MTELKNNNNDNRGYRVVAARVFSPKQTAITYYLLEDDNRERIVVAFRFANISITLPLAILLPLTANE